MKVNLHSSPLDLIESMHIYGLHKISKELAEIFTLTNEHQCIVEKYADKTKQASFTEEEDNELFVVPGIGSADSKLFLRSEAAILPKNSNILEVGTFVGASSISLLQGAKKSSSNLTCIDLLTGFEKYSRNTKAIGSPQHWENLQWENNVKKYSDIVQMHHGCSVPLLRDFIKRGLSFDLIFLDSSHEIETHYELALLSCLASRNCKFILDDVIDFNDHMSSAWSIMLKYFLGFPRFFENKFATAYTKNSIIPMNFGSSAPHKAYLKLYRKIKEYAASYKTISWQTTNSNDEFIIIGEERID